MEKSAERRRRQIRFPPPRHDQELVRRLGMLVATGRFAPVIDDRRYPLERIADAYRYVETGQKVGNVVISLEPGARKSGRPGAEGPDR